MRKRSWQMALAVIALIATAMALYVQLSAWRARQEEDRLAAARLEQELEESRSGTEAIEQRRAELAREDAAERPGDQPLPGAVLRRSENGGSVLQHVHDTQDEQAIVLARLEESLATLALQMERSDQALRRDLEQVRARVQREQAVSNKTLILLLVALIPLVLHLLFSLRPP